MSEAPAANPTPSSSSKSSKKKWLRIAIGVVAGYLVICGALVVAAALPARAAQSTLSEVATGVDAAAIADGSTEERLASASEDLATAHGRLDNVVLKPLRIVPLAGKQLTSAIRLTNAGSEAAAVTLDTLQQSRQLDTSDKVGTLQRISEITNANDQRLRQIDLGPSDGLVGPLADARRSAVDNLNKLDSGLVRASAASAGLAQLLGNDGNYLLVAANNAEMRNGSGMWLQAGLLTTGNSRLDVGEMVSVATFGQPDGSIAWPDDMNNNWGFLGHRSELQNLMLSPRFETSAALAKRIWEADGNPEVDGVIAIDVKMIEALLRVTGPVTAADTTLNADNVTKTLLFDQYRGVDYDTAANNERRDDLSQVAAAVFDEFNSASLEPAAAARHLAQAATGRHVMIWSEDDQQQALWAQAGLSGDVGLTDTMVGLVNLGTNKMDQFMKVDSSIDTRRNDERVETTIEVEVRNEAPEQGPVYVLGPAAGIAQEAGDYLGFVAFTLPHDSSDITFGEGIAPTILGRDGGNVLAATNIQMGRGQTQVFRINFSRPGDAKSTDILPSARIPAMSWENDGDNWTGSASRKVTY